MWSCKFMYVSEWKYLVYDCGQVLGAGQRLKELYAQQGGHRVRQHVLDGARWCGDTKDEHQWDTFNVPAAERRDILLREQHPHKPGHALPTKRLCITWFKDLKATVDTLFRLDNLTWWWSSFPPVGRRIWQQLNCWTQSCQVPADEYEILKNSWIESLQIFENNYDGGLLLLIFGWRTTLFSRSVGFLKNTKRKGEVYVLWSVLFFMHLM